MELRLFTLLMLFITSVSMLAKGSMIVTHSLWDISVWFRHEVNTMGCVPVV